MARDFVLSIDVGFPSHPKTQRFCRLMGEPIAFAYLIQLWTWAVEAAPDGDLRGQDPADIEWATGYRGNDGKCYRALRDAGFIDDDGAPVSLHNWMKPGHTGFAIKQMEAERARWRRSKGIPDDSARNYAGISAEATSESTGTPPPSRFTVLKETLPARDPGTTEQTTESEPMTPGKLMKLWGEARNAEFGGHPFNVNGFGVKAENQREASDMIGSTIGAAVHVEASMRKFWRTVKAGGFREARKMARDPSFAFGCWFRGFPGDFEEAIGVMPEIRVSASHLPGRSSPSRAPPSAAEAALAGRPRDRPIASVPGDR